jgi:hypothetical protein
VKTPKPKFNDWLQQSFLLLGRQPKFWLCYGLLVGVMLVVGRVSPIIGIFSTVLFLFSGVGLAKYSDLKTTSDSPVGFYWAIKQTLPLAVLAASAVVLSWFLFVLIANVLSGEFYKTAQFFFNWGLRLDPLVRQSTRDLASWAFTYANFALILVLLIVNIFISWFCFPLMLFKSLRFSQAKQKSHEAVAKNQMAIYQLLGFVVVNALMCSSVIPLFTPVLFALVSVLMYVSYKSIFEPVKEEAPI